MERRVAVAATVIGISVFGLLLLAVPAFFLTFDEAKYIGIGYNLVDGVGPRTPFGGYFLPHAPVWSGVLAYPQAVAGIDPLATGHLLNAVAGIALIALTAGLGWRVRPAIGGLAAAGLVGVTYLHDLTRTARLDVPAAALALGYLALGLVAVRRGGAWLGIATGAMFALAFTVKEIALPLAPVPFLAAILWGLPWRRVLGSAGWTLAAASVGVSWWFLLVAQLSGVVYRLGTPAWTLAPIAVAVGGLSILMILAGRGTSFGRLERRLAGVATLEPGAFGRRAVVIGLTVAWCAALTWVFAGTLEVRGTDLIDPAQLGRYAATWLPGLLKVVALIGIVGVLLSLGAWRTATGARERHAIGDLWLATICSVPLVLLVVEVGEPPRNYLAQIGILACLAAAGWLWAGEAVLRRASGRLSSRATAIAVPVAILVVVVASSAVLGYHALTFRESRSGAARQGAIETTVDWFRKNATHNERVAIGSFLSYEISLGLRGANPTRQVRHQQVVSDPTAPQGIRVSGEPPRDDWIAIDVAPRNVNEFEAFSAAELAKDLRESGADLYVYATEAATSAPTVVNALDGVPGLTEVASWTFPAPSIPVGIHLYRVDPDALHFATDRVHVSPEALERLVGQLEAAGDAGRPTARNLADRVVVTPPTAATDALIVRLKQLGGAAGG
ncbi:MAG: hypothetical protein ACJ77F_13730 [Chloroflexota bacterium]